MRLQVPGVRAGRLEGGDVVIDGTRVADDYELALERNQQVTIVTRGGVIADSGDRRLDVVTQLLAGGHEVLRDDDSATRGNARNSRIIFRSPSRAVYTVRVTAFSAWSNRGPYEIEVYQGARPTQY